VTTSPAPTDAALARGSALRGGLLTGAVAVAVNLVVWAVARAAGADLVVQVGGGQEQTVAAAAVVIMSLVPLLAGAYLLAALRRRGRSDRLWLGAVATVTVLSLLPLLGDVAGATRAWLAVMHLVAGGLAATLLPRTVGAPPTR
jgi:hypothetical protein